MSGEPKFLACAAVEAILDDTSLALRINPVPPLVVYHLCEADLPLFKEAGQMIAEAAPRIRCPVYLAHAETDELVPLNVARSVLGVIESRKRLDVTPGAPCYTNLLRNHYNAVLDHLNRCVPSAFDWLAGELLKA